MRRPALFIAGMLLATGTGLVAASPAAAAVSGPSGDNSRWHCHWINNHDWDDWDWDDGDHWTVRRHDGDNRRRYCHRHRGHGNWHGHGGHGGHGGHVSIGIGSGGIGVHVGGGGH